MSEFFIVFALLYVAIGITYGAKNWEKEKLIICSRFPGPYQRTVVYAVYWLLFIVLWPGEYFDRKKGK